MDNESNANQPTGALNMNTLYATPKHVITWYQTMEAILADIDELDSPTGADLIHAARIEAILSTRPSDTL